MCKYFVSALFLMATIGVSAMPQPQSCIGVLSDLNRFLHHAKTYGLAIPLIAEELAYFPGSDLSVTDSLVNLLPGGSGVQQWERNFIKDDYYSLVELAILRRNARGLSSISVDLKYTKRTLGRPVRGGYLSEILLFHRDVDLRNFGDLGKIAATNCVNHPATWNLYSDAPDWKPIVDKFKADFGIGIGSPRQ